MNTDLLKGQQTKTTSSWTISTRIEGIMPSVPLEAAVKRIVALISYRILYSHNIPESVVILFTQNLLGAFDMTRVKTITGLRHITEFQWKGYCLLPVLTENLVNVGKISDTFDFTFASGKNSISHYKTQFVFTVNKLNIDDLTRLIDDGYSALEKPMDKVRGAKTVASLLETRYSESNFDYDSIRQKWDFNLKGAIKRKDQDRIMDQLIGNSDDLESTTMIRPISIQSGKNGEGSASNRTSSLFKRMSNVFLTPSQREREEQKANLESLLSKSGSSKVTDV